MVLMGHCRDRGMGRVQGLTLPSLQGFRSFQKVCIWVRSTLLSGMDTSPMGSLRLKRS